MRILFLSYFYEYNYGGAEPVARTLRHELVKRGDAVDVLCLAGGPAVQSGTIWRLPLPEIALRYPELAKKILLFLNNPAFDRNILNRAYALRLPMESYDSIHCQDAFSLVIGTQLAGQFNKPLGLTLHDNYPRRIIDNLTQSHLTRVLKIIAWRRDQKLRRHFRKCHWVAAVSNYVRDNAVDFLQPDPPRVYTVYNPYPAALNASSNKSFSTGPQRVLFIGRLSREKGIDLLIEALEGYSAPIQVTVLGLEGSLKANIQKVAQMDKRVRLEAPVPSHEVHKFIAAHDLVCCPANWDEPFGLTVLESRIHGKPILTTDRGGIPEILTGYTRALVIETKGKSREELVKALRTSLGPALALSKTNLDPVAERDFFMRFSTETFTDRYTALYRNGSLSK
jgi:glycosyltransferase involved in cell wall biosynthesis